MDMYVFAAVLLAAAFHAGWNALIKVGLDQFLSVTLIFLSAGFISLCAAPFVPFPTAEAWPWLLASAVIHVGYKMVLIKAYQVGDMGQVYPIARGTAPLLITIAMMVGFGEYLSLPEIVGVGVLAMGICLMSLRGGKQSMQLEWRPLGYALMTSAFIACYTITDGLGARVNASAHGYAVWLFLIDAVMMFAILLLTRGIAGISALRPYWCAGIGGGIMSLAAYWIIIWAMTVAPIALVAAFRESSVLFAAAISVFVLKESLTAWRTISAVMIVAGIVIAKIA